MSKYYAGIGSRGIPEKISKDMQYIASYLSNLGYILRSGNAEGADQAFAKGVNNDLAQIWLPWKDFQKGFTLLHPKHKYIVIGDNDKEAYDSVVKYHPNGKNLTETSRKFMARNYRQVVGKDEPDSMFVVCWTVDGKLVGGTAQAIRIALDKDIPVYNLAVIDKEQVIRNINILNELY